MTVLTAAPWQCGNCDSYYRTWLSRCPRCHGPGPTEEEPLLPKISHAAGASVTSPPMGADTGEVEPPAPVDVAEPAATTDQDGPKRPPVNAPKSEWVDYGAARYDLDRGYLEEFNKTGDAGLVAVLTGLDDGTFHVVNGEIYANEHDADDEPASDAAVGEQGPETVEVEEGATVEPAEVEEGQQPDTE